MTNMTSKERKAQEAVGSLEVDETHKTYDIQYLGPKDKDPGFLVVIDGEQIPFSNFYDIMSYFTDQVRDAIWDTFVPDGDGDDGKVIRDRVKHIEMTIRITHTDA